MSESLTQLTRKDFASEQDVRWCPGCGDYVILSSLHKAMAELGTPPHENVVVSGIGCSSRLPYYMDTYGFHGIHGRAPTLASGVKTASPELTVWVVTGDGDGLSIGGNHLLHTLRRNSDLNILLFNNRIYGLTKGQYSPCSEQGLVTKTSPMGTVEQPIKPVSFAIASQATFVARCNDTDPKHLTQVMVQAAQHKGVSFIEVYQNCRIFYDGAFDDVTERKVRSEKLVYLEHGKPLIFGKLRNKGIRLRGLAPEIVEFEPDNPPGDLLVHDQESEALAYLLAQLEHPKFPEPMGIFRRVERPTYEQQVYEQMAVAKKKSPNGTFADMFRRGAETWTLTGKGNGKSATVGGVNGKLDGPKAEKDSYISDLDKDGIVYEGIQKAIREVDLGKIDARSETIIVTAETTAVDALERMRSGEKLGTVIVRGEGNQVAGILTERDLLHRIEPDADLSKVKVGDIMTPTPEFLAPADTVAHALNFMGARGYRRVPITGKDGVKIITIDDVLDFINSKN